MLHEKSCLIINMPKIMIIKYQQFAKTNTFSPIFSQDTWKSGFGNGQKWGWTPPERERKRESERDGKCVQREGRSVF